MTFLFGPLSENDIMIILVSLSLYQIIRLFSPVDSRMMDGLAKHLSKMGGDQSLPQTMTESETVSTLDELSKRWNPDFSLVEESGSLVLVKKDGEIIETFNGIDLF